MEKKSGNFLEQDAARIASSPAGKELMSLLYHQNSKDIEKAKQLAASGDLNAEAQALSGLLGSPEVRKLISQLEENNG